MTDSMFEDVAGMSAILVALALEAQKTMPRARKMEWATELIGDLVLFHEAAPIIRRLEQYTKQTLLSPTPANHFSIAQARRLLHCDSEELLITTTDALPVFSTMIAMYNKKGVSAFNEFRTNLWHAVGTYVPHYRRE
jgi:hypothetical protein